MNSEIYATIKFTTPNALIETSAIVISATQANYDYIDLRDAEVTGYPTANLKFYYSVDAGNTNYNAAISGFIANCPPPCIPDQGYMAGSEIEIKKVRIKLKTE
jgi:hypothetical protein